ncbi:class II fructose-bisphosphatase [Candidatus Methylomirabilis sp.]|uniref:Fructose-1,6-bisphosphatase n=1 Tax=Candidatus Methylomirabilis tolerans TaxID=3123416 RepID=A0AAJ1AIR3_9BACT|nr:class II fructose-bisphosphatase [Candidatus Methylomirabilis sp.]
MSSVLMMNGCLGRDLALELVRVTEAAALAAGRWMGRGQKDAGDEAAVHAMRAMLRTVDIDGVVVIGEGEKDEAPMLFNGETVGTGRGPAVDIAVDPVEGTSLLAHGRPDSIAVIGVAPRGTMWSPGPGFYMNKLVVGREAREAISPLSLAAPVADTLAAIAKAKHKAVTDLTVFILDKPRHAGLIADVRAAGARVLTRTDGDVAGALMAATPGSGVDILMGIGGTPEGVIAACAVRALGGAMLGQLAPQKPGEREALLAAGLDINRVLTERDLVSSDDVFFAATGITDGLLMQGVRYTDGGSTTHSIVMRGKSRTRRTIQAEHCPGEVKTVRLCHQI